MAAHLLTFSRVVLAPVLAYAVGQPRGSLWGPLAALVFLWCAWSDVADGWLARRFGTAGPVGRWLDHVSDIVVLLAGFVAFSSRGFLPWWVPAAVGSAFVAYAIEQRWGSPGAQSRRASRVGHWGGVANYVLLGVLIGQFTLRLEVLPAGFLSLWYLCVLLYSGAAILLRFSERKRGKNPLVVPARS